jgi:hypothetical protein
MKRKRNPFEALYVRVVCAMVEWYWRRRIKRAAKKLGWAPGQYALWSKHIEHTPQWYDG